MVNIDENIKFYVETRLPEIVSKISRSNDTLRFRCPLCGDSKKSKGKMRGNYYRRTGTFYCYNCDSTLVGLNIIARLGNLNISDVKKDYLQKFIKIRNSSIQSITENFKQKQDLVVEKSQFEIPDYWVDIPKDLLQVHVLGRKVLDAKGAPKNWRLYYNNSTDRIVIPWIESNQITYYQERAIRSWQPNKYLFPKDSSKDIFGLDKIDINWKYILFTEGCFDSVFLPNGIAIGGIYPNNHQIEILDRISIDQQLVWFPDNPWVDNSTYQKIITQSKKYPSQKIFMWNRNIPEKDVNDVVLAINDIDFFFDNKQFIENRITTLNKATIMLKFGSDIIS